MRSRGDKTNNQQQDFVPIENEERAKTSLLDDGQQSYDEQQRKSDGEIDEYSLGKWDRFKKKTHHFLCGCKNKRNRCLIWTIIIALFSISVSAAIISWIIVSREDLFFCSTNDYSCYSRYIRNVCADSSKACFTSASSLNPLEEMPVNLTVLMFADSTITAGARSVFDMSLAENPDIILHAGDYDYLGSPDKWEEFLNSTLGASYPFFAAVGNHDDPNYYSENGYQQFALKRLKGVGGDLHCLGDLGVKTVCTWKGLTFVLAAPGTEGLYHSNFIEASFGVFRSKWNIAVWHKVSIYRSRKKKKIMTT